jgi:hypothetical protein
LEGEYKKNPNDFSLKDNRTRNFVVFDPGHAKLKTWNDVPLEPMEEGFDPFLPSEPGDVRARR